MRSGLWEALFGGLLLAIAAAALALQGRALDQGLRLGAYGVCAWGAFLLFAGLRGYRRDRDPAGSLLQGACLHAMVSVAAANGELSDGDLWGILNALERMSGEPARHPALVFALRQLVGKAFPAPAFAKRAHLLDEAQRCQILLCALVVGEQRRQDILLTALRVKTVQRALELSDAHLKALKEQVPAILRRPVRAA